DVVAPTQDAGAAVVARVDDADVGILRNHGYALGRGPQVGFVELLAAGQRGALALGATDELLLVAEFLAIPQLDGDHGASGDQIRATGQPGRRAIVVRCDPDVFGH